MNVEIRIPNQASIHSLGNFLGGNQFFATGASRFELVFHPRFVYLQPFALSMLAAWGDYWTKQGVPIICRNISASGVDYAWRMGLFSILRIDHKPAREEHEEAGRFLPLRRITEPKDVSDFLADIAPLLHRPEHIHAVQYCLSETIRNVLEHAGGAPAFCCAQFYKEAQRVSIGVADYGIGIFGSLSKYYPVKTASAAIREALKPGVTGAPRGAYGTPDNAGAGLFFLKCIAKSSRSYLALGVCPSNRFC